MQYAKLGYKMITLITKYGKQSDIRTKRYLVSRSKPGPRFVRLAVVHINLRHFDVVTELENTPFTQFMYRRTKTQLHHMASYICMKHEMQHHYIL